MFTIDTRTDLGARAVARLTDETVAWLTTISPSLVPQPTPVWFSWTGADILIASQPHTHKVRNLAARPGASISFNSTASGGDVVVLTGTAAVDPGPLAGTELAAYDVKYGADIRGLGLTAEQFHADYSQVVRVSVTRLRGF
ncbi:TIGR03667 family PPOX class F420-dependent oxidoreductase [Occultella glacieicola]|uniref:TIGR03667 family PPOX class F420-dependent oxidoreductase n=1 Tax=Occultella glacieicola TaxID=2518684 RepID=A0ABY2DZM5_9MICO|nr:TIGR03667 family PPOX class F420-dependent oxidoreductase [Occultella glacieicola]TDE90337.1 TIGR03667 family PPOX class F420-dependent oxidoreductase [Occultella glacieicola]